MAASIQDLCAAFCEIAQKTAPNLSPQEDGTVAFNLVWRGVTVDVMHLPHVSARHVFVFLDMGPMEREGMVPARVMQALLEANFVALRPVPLAFSRHPQTGAAVLQRTYALDTASATGLLQVIEEGIELVLRWREDCFLSAPDELNPSAKDIACLHRV